MGNAILNRYIDVLKIEYYVQPLWKHVETHAMMLESIDVLVETCKQDRNIINYIIILAN